MFNNYAIVQGVDHIVPVDIYLPGCPPRPEMLIDAILKLHHKILNRSSARDRDAEITESSSSRLSMLPMNGTATAAEWERAWRRRRDPPETERQPPGQAGEERLTAPGEHRHVRCAGYPRHLRIRRPADTPAVAPPRLARPYGGYFDAVVDALGTALTPTGLASTTRIERVEVDYGELTLYVRREKLPRVVAERSARSDVALRVLLRRLRGRLPARARPRLHSVYHLMSITLPAGPARGAHA